ncbi:hypothetical protein BDV98DRAFT_591503 [Pterulicium gracile]|uniref:Uncharacterized protein n=1 Tax=Pterulicium gracile TaxID=1884261 RepID=A0A5C3QNW4_9AGAR|nr:hypothetical protein BDV98DRAFT_591503 [Pterula gracilis]
MPHFTRPVRSRYFDLMPTFAMVVERDLPRYRSLIYEERHSVVLYFEVPLAAPPAVAAPPVATPPAVVPTAVVSTPGPSVTSTQSPSPPILSSTSSSSSSTSTASSSTTSSSPTSSSSSVITSEGEDLESDANSGEPKFEDASLLTQNEP